MAEEKCILCVDDEQNILKALERLLLDEDYLVLTTSSCAEGLRILETTPVQLVVSDYRMPDMNGVEFLREVRKRWPDTIRLVLSGYADAAAIVAAVNEGQIYRFIPKPWDDDELKAVLAKAFDKYDARQDRNCDPDELKARNAELSARNDRLEKHAAKQTQELLSRDRSLERSREILDVLPLAVVGIDKDGIIFQCNGMCAELAGGSECDWPGRHWLDALPEALHPLLRNLPDGGPARKEVVIGDHRYRAVVVRMQTSTMPDGAVLTLEEVAPHA